MRADLPSAASGGQGTRHATATPAATRTRGRTGGVGDVEGHAPLTPCRISAVDARKAPASPNGHSPAGRHSVASRAGYQTRMPGSSRKPAAEKEKPFPSGENVQTGEMPQAEKVLPVRRQPPHREEAPSKGKCSPPVRAQAEKSQPASPASRGAEAIPATRERRSRRAYHPRSGKMRADLPPAASGGQGTRHATATPSTTRTRGSTGVVGGVEGHAPLTPCPSPGGDHARMPG